MDELDLQKRALIAAVVLLGLGVLPIWPYGYYTFLRIGVTGVAVYWLYARAPLHKQLIVPFASVAALYNPIIPVYLTRPIWTPLNLATAVLFLYAIRGLNVTNQPENGTDPPRTSP